MRARRLVAALWLASTVVAVGAGAAHASGPPSVRRLDGTLHLAPGRCNGGHPTGSYLSVTFGTRAIRNPASSCENGSITLLRPGRTGLSTDSYSPNADVSFDGSGNARSTAIAEPVKFDHHDLGIVTSARNLQDAPSGAAAFALPKIYAIGDRLRADLRSVQILYGGFADTSCAGASGYGCWLVGAERATGTYNPRTHAATLSWFSGTSFTPTSAGTAIHLAGTFVGATRTVAQGTPVELGTASFAAGPATPTVHTATRSTSHRAGKHRQSARHGRRHSKHGLALASDSGSTTTGSPRMFLIAEILVMINIVTFVALARRRSRK